MYTFLQKQAPNFVAMRALQQHILAIIGSYNGTVPLTHFLKSYFKAHPILGSRDRKVIADAVYSYYRCAKAFPESLSVWDKVGLSVFLSENENPHTRKLIPDQLKDRKVKSVSDRINALEESGVPITTDHLLPADIALSGNISKNLWLESIWQKPRVFFRITVKNQETALQKLSANGLEIRTEGNNCFSCAAGSALEKILAPFEYRIQDFSSQQTAGFFSLKPGYRVWDCCSGAGGKSLLACETESGIRVTVSDVRASILHNLGERFRQYGRPIPEQILVSASDHKALTEKLGNRRFEHIIADVPCSGSGTWARTPEQLYFFNPDTLGMFADRQIAILKNISEYVVPGGFITYITCSLFEAENEAVLRNINRDEFEILKADTLDGIEKKADSMFAALLRRR